MKLVRVNPPTREFKDTQKESYSVFKKYQMGIHKEEEWDCSEEQFDQFLCEGPLQVETEGVVVRDKMVICYIHTYKCTYINTRDNP